MKSSAPVLERERTSAPPEKKRRICFVCTGNTCRSPMAAALYNYLHENEPTFAVSAGLSANEGEPIAFHALLALKGRGIPSTEDNCYEAHTATPLTEKMLEESDQLYALTSRHYEILCALFPAYTEKFRTLGEIADPYGGTLALYMQTLTEIEEALSCLN